MDWFQFCERAGHSGACCQRCCPAGARELPRGQVLFLGLGTGIAGVIAVIFAKHKTAIGRDTRVATGLQSAISTPSERPQIVTLTREATVGHFVLPPSTQLSVVGLSGDNVTISYEGSDYEIPAS